MSAPPAGSANGSPLPGYYPDPSIPGYIRYWDGSSWVPGTSRPQPGPGEPPPEPPAQRGGATRGVVPGQRTGRAAPPGRTTPPAAQAGPPQPARDEETGPVFLDEDDGGQGGSLPEVRQRGDVAAREEQQTTWDDPRRLHGSSPEAGGAWGADASQQGGLGGGTDQRVSWGADAPAAQPDGSVPDPATGDTVGIRLPRGGAHARRPDDDRADGGAAASATGTGSTPWQSGQADASQQAWQQDQAAAGGGHGWQDAAQGGGTPQQHGTGVGVGVGDEQASWQGWEDPHGGAADARGQWQQGVHGGVHGGAADGAQAHAGQQAQWQDAAAPYQQGQGGLGVGVPQQGADPQQGAAPQQHGQEAPPWQGGGAREEHRPAWAQQVHDLAQSGGPGAAQEPPAPWRPPVDDPFLRAAREQARPAGLGRRLGAAVVDGLVVAAVTALAALPFVGRTTDHIQSQIDAARQAGVTRQIWLVDGTTGGYLAVVLGVFLVYGLLCEAWPTAKWGRTLGKKLFGLTVMDVERQDPPHFGAAVRRWLVHRLLGLLVIGVLDVLWCLFDRPWRQCWHDKAGRTFVAGGTSAD